MKRLIFIIPLLAFGLITCKFNSNEQATHVQPDDSAQVDGKTLYEQKCKVCHGADGKLGLSGASDLSVSVLAHEEVVNVVTNGRNTMVGWKGVLSPTEIEALATYVEGLRAQ